MVSKKVKKKMVPKKVKKKKKIFFFPFLNWENQTWYWEKKRLFSIANGAEIRPLEKGRKGPGMVVIFALPHSDITHKNSSHSST